VDPQAKGLLLTWIPTTWSKILEGRGAGDRASRARNDLLVRYHEAVYHYFRLKIRDEHAAQELYSNFALRLIESDRLIRNADPARGRFRDYLKTALHHMVVDHYRRQGRQKKPQRLEGDVPGPEPKQDDFDPVWRQELLNQAWKALGEADRDSGQLHSPVLRYQSDHPDARAPAVAEWLAARCGRPFTPEAIRATLHRAREKFARLLVEEVEHSLGQPTLDELERELVDLHLLPYCQRALGKRREAAK
jgi:RNA polymerase sigma-70 factor (ECF subfamily)